jgi:formyltetrahydrofolate deformylase
MTATDPSVILLIRCKDRKGIVARVAGFIHDAGGNILDSDHHTDREANLFLMRTEFALEGFQIPRDEIASAFAPVAMQFDMWCEVHCSDERARVAILVSRQDRCLADLLRRQRRGEMKIAIPVIISDHDVCAMWAQLFGIPFHVFPVPKRPSASRSDRCWPRSTGIG